MSSYREQIKPQSEAVFLLDKWGQNNKRLAIEPEQMRADMLSFNQDKPANVTQSPKITHLHFIVY